MQYAIIDLEMNITSVLFIFYFLPFVIFGNYLFNRYFKKAQNLFLIITSLLFYAFAGYKLFLFVLLVTLLLYIYSLLIKKYHKRSILFVFIILLVLILSYFKYTNFLINNLNRFLHLAIAPKELIVPLGISFVTFEAISYLVDVYKGEDSGNLFDILLFVSFFPKVSSGPIITWHKFNIQSHDHSFSFDKLIDGLEEFIKGLAKKVLIADVLGTVVNSILYRYENNTIDSFSAILASLCFMFELYYDFAGYSNMATGISKMLGFEFPKNFDEPYRSTSISEFWRRWHISLGAWFREYIYIPLGGNRKHVYFNLFVVFLLTGIWHGAGFNYILWGIANGLLVIIERSIRDKKWYQKIPNIFKQLFVLIFIYFSWTSFCFVALGDVFNFEKLMFVPQTSFVNFTYQHYLTAPIIIALLFALINDILLPLKYKEKIKIYLNNHQVIKYLLLIILFVVSLIWLVNSSYNPFIYYKF